ncbi:hypothetical protein ACI2KR_27180 [Pseudomonas luteola]
MAFLTQILTIQPEPLRGSGTEYVSFKSLIVIAETIADAYENVQKEPLIASSLLVYGAKLVGDVVRPETLKEQTLTLHQFEQWCENQHEFRLLGSKSSALGPLAAIQFAEQERSGLMY